MELTPRVAVFQDIPEPKAYQDEGDPGDSFFTKTVDIGGEEFVVEFGEGDEGEWGIAFYSYDEYEMPSYRPTGKGNQWEVYHQILGMIRDFIVQKNPKRLTFSGATPKQDKVYQLLLKKLMPLGWRKQGNDFIVDKPLKHLRSASRQAVFQNLPHVEPTENDFDDDTRRTQGVTDATSGQEYQVSFDHLDGRNWAVSFHTYGEYGEEVYRPTGEGNPFQVYPQVFSAIRNFIVDKRPHKLLFDPADPKQGKLYERFIQKFFPNPDAVERLDDGFILLHPYRELLRQRRTNRKAVFQDLQPPETLMSADEEGIFYRKFLVPSTGEPLELRIYTFDGLGHVMLRSGTTTGNPYKPTGKGGGFEAYRALLSFIKEYIDTYNPKQLEFGSPDPKLMSVYTRMVKRFFPGKWESPSEKSIVVHLHEDTREAARVAVFQDLPIPEYFESRDTSRFFSRKFESANGEKFELALLEGRNSGVWNAFFTTLSDSGRGSYKPTGKGGGFDTYKRMLAALKEFIEKYKPEAIRFSGSGKLQSMYTKMLDRFFPGQWTGRASGDFLLTLRNNPESRTSRVARGIEAIFQREELDREPVPENVDITNPDSPAFASRKTFSTSDGREFMIYFSEQTDGIYETAFGQKLPSGAYTYGITGGGSANEIFRKVYALIREFIANFHPKQLKFSSSAGSRSSLYRALIRRLAPDGIIWDEYDDEDLEETEFTVDFT